MRLPILPLGAMLACLALASLAQADDAQYLQIRGTPGFWRLAQDTDGTWWFLSPTGEREFLNTVTTVVPYQHGRREQGPHYVSRNWEGDSSTTAWASATLERVRNAGFKGIGAWSHLALHNPAVNADTPITRDLNLWTWCSGPGKRVYHPDFRASVEAAVRKQVIPLRDSKTLVGYFTDNELGWEDSKIGPAAYFDGLDPDDPSRRKVVEVIRRLWPDMDAFNADFNTTLGSWSDLDALSTVPIGPGYGRLYEAFRQQVATDYFCITSELVRKHDPNHLVLGVRYRGWIGPEIVRGQRGHTDAVSINYYVADARLDRELFESLHHESGGQPVMVTEYSFHALDGRSGNRNTFGFVAQVPDQRARADGYTLMTSNLAKVPYIVGADWFQWSDEPPSGRTMDGEDVNFGIVDVDDHEYESLVDAIRELTPRLNDLHAAGESAEAWRADFVAETVEAALPYLPSTPQIDASLREWDERYRLADVKRGETVGAERHDDAGAPTVYAGWNEAGLYLAIEVQDAQILAAEADAKWWNQDAVELFISTRPDADRAHRKYSAFDHQFYFVPNPFPANGSSGTWGRWSRPGDDLDGKHQIPAAGVVDAARVLPGRYVTEVFIPASALNGFDPVEHPAIRFNVHVRDYQTAIDHYWSAPKEAAMHFRPATWGRLVLEQPDRLATVAE